MVIQFEKFHGAGNDFVLIDNRSKKFQFTRSQIISLCHRRYGIGADGLILIESHPELDFEMKYFNADGGLGSMCGNGGRCAVIFARKLGMIESKTSFLAYDGRHEANVNADGSVKLSMNAVNGFELNEEGQYILNTGSPHLVEFVPDVSDVNVMLEGQQIRFNDRFKKEGINVNFVTSRENEIQMRTYERGVENETLSCGTGTVAVAIAVCVERKLTGEQVFSIEAPGGNLKVHLNRTGEKFFENSWLEGPVAFVFAGSIEC